MPGRARTAYVEEYDPFGLAGRIRVRSFMVSTFRVSNLRQVLGEVRVIFTQLLRTLTVIRPILHSNAATSVKSPQTFFLRFLLSLRDEFLNVNHVWMENDDFLNHLVVQKWQLWRSHTVQFCSLVQCTFAHSYGTILLTSYGAKISIRCQKM